MVVVESKLYLLIEMIININLLDKPTSYILCNVHPPPKKRNE